MRHIVFAVAVILRCAWQVWTDLRGGTADEPVPRA